MSDLGWSEQALWIDTDRQQVGWGDQAEALTGKWDAAFLAGLVDTGAPDARPLLDAASMGRALARHGLQRPLAPTEWGRILDRINDKLGKLMAGSTVSARVSYGARQKTGGPWRLECALPVKLIAAPTTAQAGNAPDSPSGADMPGSSWLILTESADPHVAVRLAERFKQAVEALWKAVPEQALQLLADDTAWEQASVALDVLRLLRLAEALRGAGDAERARQAIERARLQVTRPELRAVFQPHLSLAMLRADYGESPVVRYPAVHAQLSSDMATYWNNGTSRVDAMAWAEHLHLAALCQRRYLELETDPLLPSGQAAVRTMLQLFESALLLFLLVRNYDRAQHVCANLAYAHYKLAVTLGSPHWDLAVDWHGLSFAMHASFGGAESSAWEYIYIGELWLCSSEAQAAFRRRFLQAGWNDVTPDRAQFYEDGCRIARQLGDPRQMAYTLLNRYRFHLTGHARQLRSDALRELQAFLRSHPVQHQLLVAEGYPVPKLEATP